MSQKALLLNEAKTPLVLEQRPIPEPKEDQLLVKVIAASLNPHDAKVRDAGLFFTGKPVILANDLAGEIIKLGSGPNVADFAVGEHVFAQSNPVENDAMLSVDDGGLQEYALVNVRYAAKVAATGLSDDEAVTFPTNIVPSWVAFFHESAFGFPAPYGPKAGSFDFASQTLLVVGGGSNIGRLVVQIAKLLAFGRVVVVAGKSNEDELKGMGATHVVDRHGDKLVERIREVVGDDLQYAIDTVNYGPDQHVGVAALSNSKRGILATLLPAESSEFTKEQVGAKNAGYERRFVIGSSKYHSDWAAEFWKHLPGLIREGHLRPGRFDIIEGLDAAKVNATLDQYTGGTATAKVNIHP